ncbi:acyl carrier protein [Shimia abyssi]|uniref:[acyl-carrier-protein] S-malonyltransferase n=1 Tax=Shimia abyssi TaxID=1662395 RepID=A0A2P8FBU5_9RHOB|nr:acyl carrier protein [Shimia abyssi]PSL19142.1 hypothetical protein CLV88_10785 [Shimia abyssi]
MTKERIVVVAPGRGTYNKAELGVIARQHGDKVGLLAQFDAYRAALGQETVSALDGAARYVGSKHTRGDNASALIYAASLFDFLSIDRDRYEILAVTGNSMGWYTALACGGALDAMGGLEVVNTMGTLMQERLIGGQLIYPFVDEDWRAIPGERARIEAKMVDIDGRAGHDLALSIDLGGMLVLAGNAEGLAAYEREMPVRQERFPMRLQNHAAFHTTLQAPVAQDGRARLPASLFSQPNVALIDGRGALWQPGACDLEALWAYTLGHQVVAPYDLSAALRTAARELMPDAFVVLGPGTTLGGSVAQSLIRWGWRGWDGKRDFQVAQSEAVRLRSMGIAEQRALVV